jgi:hypothetical protein
MSSETISMRELEAESAELLPSRETLNCWRSHGSTTITSQSGNGNGILNFFNGSNVLNNNFNNNNVNVLGIAWQSQ